jgi:hypothetical protein
LVTPLGQEIMIGKRRWKAVVGRGDALIPDDTLIRLG